MGLPWLYVVPSTCSLFLSRRCPLLATSCPSFFCLLSMLISDSRFDLVWFRLSCDHGWIRSGSVNVRKQQQQQQQYNGGFLPGIILLAQCYYHGGTRLNTMKRFCICSLLSHLNVLTFSPLTGECSEGLGAFRFFFKIPFAFALANQQPYLHCILHRAAR